MTPFEFIQYVAMRQLDDFSGDGVARALAGFASIESDAETYTEQMYESYLASVGEGEPGDFAEEARDQGIEYYRVLSEMRQAILNLLAAGLYHLFEQHRNALDLVMKEAGTAPLDFESFDGWEKVSELRLLANTVKHAEDSVKSSATRLKGLRPELFVPPVLSGSSLATHLLHQPTANPLGGTDLFVSRTDLEHYRDALWHVWAQARTLV